jgi:methylthioribose-1-phosphate isomerase
MNMKLPITRAFIWKKNALALLDQRHLPDRQIWLNCRTWQKTAEGIRSMVVRGAPAIGCTAAYGIVLASRAKVFRRLSDQKSVLRMAHKGLLAARPTAVNLRWALDRMQAIWQPFEGSCRELAARLEAEAWSVESEDRESNRAMGQYGAAILPGSATVITYCNTGSLATAGLGTAFGVIWTAFHQGKIRKAIASETRPYLQGARLTAWELKSEKIPYELITDNMAAYVMKTEPIHAVLVGADRIAANGDTANKIGTYSLAVIARHHGVPFYVVAPLSTIDLKTIDGSEIPIEQRSSEEVTSIRGNLIAPKGTVARHPAFDVTPGSLITAIITEQGMAYPPYEDSLRGLFKNR